ncbi:hypothetical protein Ddye_023088 [Dipteronia dyeriana]|uniref:Uncharacterized protein n=1 Tax=Dipteronia dyeriana TaxID=168575 RepID=A0AAD9WT22_9ROSI|nr:hypothetical protein Ddye_023088 [Dipteronia dyeriana]
MHLKNQPQVIKKGLLSINEYIVKKKSLSDALIAARQDINEQDLIAYVLGGLGQEHDLVVVTVTSKSEEITLQETQFILMNFEARLEEFASSMELPTYMANVHMKTQRSDTTKS